MDNDWYPESPSFLESSLVAPPVHPRCLPVGTALKDCAGLSVKAFALILLDDDGEEKMYTSPSLTPYMQRIFTDRFRVDFLSSVQRVTARALACNQGALHSEFDKHEPKLCTNSDSPSDRRFQYQLQLWPRLDNSDFNDSAARGKRKRPYPLPHLGQHVDLDNTIVPVRKTQQLIIEDEVEVERFYSVRFENMQQSCCKAVAKVFIQLVEPKKQSHHPYARGNIYAPEWWPNTDGENSVRHREPDHLLKSERIRLLVHILRMVVKPRQKQSATVQKLGLNISKLEEATMGSMSRWFYDTGYQGKAAKKMILEQIFKVASAEERYKNGEIDGTACFHVVYDDTNSVSGPHFYDNERVKNKTSSVPATIPTPDSQVSPTARMENQVHGFWPQNSAQQDQNHYTVSSLTYQVTPQPMYG